MYANIAICCDLHFKEIKGNLHGVQLHNYV